MKALFVYDGPIQYDEDGNYYSQVINNTVFKRYLNHADFLKVAIRTEPCGQNFNKEKTQKINTEKVSIISIPSLSNAKGFIFKRKTVRELLETELNTVDFAIIRLPSFIGEEAVNVVKRKKVPYLIEVVGCPWDSLWNYGVKGKLMAPYLTLSMRLQVKRAPFVIYVTNEILQNTYPTNAINTNCSNVELKAISQEVLKKRLQHIKSNDGKLIIGTAAAVNVPYKGHQYIIEALAKLKREGIHKF